MHKILVLQGPNLNMLGIREPQLYGSDSLADIHNRLQTMADAADIRIEFFQSNSESALIERIHQAYREQVNFILFNPAAFTHTSIALRDALLAVAIPFIEVHLSNPQLREPFRHVSYFTDIAQQTIQGLGSASYDNAMQAALNHFRSNQ